MQIRYILEIVEGGNEKYALAMPIVQSISVEPVMTDVVRYSMGDDPVREHSGIKRVTINASGHSGQSFRNGFKDDGTRLFEEAPKLFRQFDKFLEKYRRLAYERQQSGASLSNPLELVFRAPYEEVAYAVEIEAWNWGRSIETGPFNYTWSLSLNGYSPRDGKKSKNIFDTLLGGNKARAATEAINRLTAYTSQAIEQSEKFRAGLDAWRGPVQALGRLAGQAREVASAAQGVRSWPHDFAADVFTTAQNGTQAVYDQWSVLPLVDRRRIRSEMIAVLGPMAEVRRKTLNWLALNWVNVNDLTDPSENSVAHQSVMRNRTARATPAVPHAVKAGQDAATMAQEIFGDRSQWLQIAELNGSADPFSTAEGRPIGPGETMLVPSPTSAAQTSSDPRDVYGTDLKLGPDGDLVMDGTEDLALVSGQANLQQALTLRALTVQGDNGAFPDIGLPRLVGSAMYLETAGLLASQARSQFASDPRIEEVTELEVDDSQGDRLLVGALLKPVAGASFRVSVPATTGA